MYIFIDQVTRAQLSKIAEFIEFTYGEYHGRRGVSGNEVIESTLRARTPLVKLNVEDAPAEIYLKLENLQPIGSFKIRGASNAMKIARAPSYGAC